MRRAIVYDMMNRLSSKDVTALVTKPLAPVEPPEPIKKAKPTKQVKAKSKNKIS